MYALAGETSRTAGHDNATRSCDSPNSAMVIEHNFASADNVPLDLSTAAAMFVPSLMQFTVAPTYDYCIHVMSPMLRPLAAVPAPFVFRRRVRRTSAYEQE